MAILLSATNILRVGLCPDQLLFHAARERMTAQNLLQYARCAQHWAPIATHTGAGHKGHKPYIALDMILGLGKPIKYNMYIVLIFFLSMRKDKNIIQLNQCININ